MRNATGRCMCGAITYRAQIAEAFGTCYCKMCQRWAAGMYMGVLTEGFEVTAGADHLTIFKSSDWASRAFCDTCGSSIYYHMPDHGGPSVSVGTLDDANGLAIHTQYFIDRKPDSYALAGETKTLTEAEIEAMYGDD